MGLSLAQLVPTQSRASWKARMIAAAQGVGFVSRFPGLGSGSLAATGTSTVTQSVRVKVTSGGELGTAQYKLSTDGGVTWGVPTTLPSSGAIALAGAGVALQFSAGPSGAGESFTLGDTYALELTVPTLQATAWQPGSTALTLLEIFADALSELGRTAQGVTLGGLLRYSTGPWLDLLATNFYNLTRGTGLTAQRTLRLTDNGGIGPLAFSPGDIWVSTVGGLRFTNNAGGTLPAGGFVDLSFTSESVGGKFNVGPGLITQLLTSLPGATVTDPAGVSVITVAGQDIETDAALIQRCMNRWPALGYTPPANAYDLFAKTASANVTRTAVRPSPSVPGQVQVVLGGAAGAVSGADVAAVLAFINPRLGTTLTADVQSVTAVPQPVTATIYCYTGSTSQVTADITQNLTALFYGGTDTEGEQLSPVPIVGTLYLNQIVEQLQTPPGVRNAVLTAPSPAGGDIVLAWPQVATLGTLTLTVVEVPR